MNAPVPMPATSAATGPERLELRVRALVWEAPGVLSLELASPDGVPLPPFEPGAHVDLLLPDGTLRQYSLCGDPADRHVYRLGIRAVAGGWSSGYVHRKLRPGDLVTVSLPRNNFPLVEAARYLFIAGGIGVTPFLPMMRVLRAQGRPFTLLYCNRSSREAPFRAEIAALGGEVAWHGSAEGTRLDVAARLAAVDDETVVYCCGPERLMTAVEEATTGFADGRVHFEWFAPRARPADETSGGFEVVCERSGLTVPVPPDRSIRHVLADAGIEVPCSCEQGICGTCEVRVIEGEIDHRDSILSAAERAAGDTMMTCVSRARGPRLVLDI
jgi:ferredoxin-NADP reductase